MTIHKKKICIVASLFDVRYAAGCRGAGAGVWHGMQPYSIERGHGDGPILHPLLSKWASFYVVGF